MKPSLTYKTQCRMDDLSRLRHRRETYRQRISSHTTEIGRLNGLITTRNNEIFNADGRASALVMQQWKDNTAVVRGEIARLEAEK